MKIILGADHGGWQMKEKVKSWLVQEKHGVIDVGAYKKNEDDDYVDFAIPVAKELVKDQNLRGLLFCRNGLGMMIAANRFAGVRCGLAFDKRAVEKGRMDDDINCLAIPSDYVDLEKTKGMVVSFLEVSFSGEERYQRRLSKLELIK